MKNKKQNQKIKNSILKFIFDKTHENKNKNKTLYINIILLGNLFLLGWSTRFLYRIYVVFKVK